MMDDVQYSNMGLGNTNSIGGKMAIIDTGNTSIQIPATQFNQLEELMMAQDPTIYKQNVDGAEILVSTRECKFLETIYGDLEFTLQNTKIIITPGGYLYSSPNQDDCFIGVQSIPDKYNQYRLGTIFLRNFYTGLNFDKNLLLIGLNNDSENAKIHGKAVNPFLPKEKSNGPVIVVCLILLTLFGIAIGCFIRAKNNER